MKLKKNLLLGNYWAISTKFCWNDSCMAPFQKCVRWSRLPTKMAAKLKIEISSNGQNCSILSQKVPKFELYKHNDELFNTYYRIFYELWTFAYFDRLCKLEKGGWNLKKIFSSKTTEPISTKLCWNDSWVVLFRNCVRHFRTPTKMATTAELNLT